MKKSLLNACFAALFVLPAGGAIAQDAADLAPAVVSQEALITSYTAGEFAKTAAIANELLKNDPNNADALHILAVSLAETDRPREAEATLEKLKTVSPDDARVDANLCRIRMKLQSDKAIDTCLEATKRIGDDAGLLYQTAQLLEGARRDDEAGRLYEAAYRLNPGNVSYLTAYTDVLNKKNDYRKSAELTEQSIRSGANMVILYLNATLAYNRAGEYEKSIRLADEGFEKFHDPGLKLGKAEALAGLKKYEESEAIWKELEEEVGEKSILRARYEVGYAKSLLALSCTTEAFKTCASQTPDPCCEREKKALPLMISAQDKGEKLLKKEKTLFVNLGLAQILNSRLEDAEALLTKAAHADDDRDHAGALAALAVALYEFGDERDREAGRRYYAQAVEYSPDFADIGRVRETRVWPPRLIDTLKTIQDDVAAAQSPKKKSGCGCEIRRASSAPLSGLFAMFFGLFAMIGIRRKPAR